MEKQNLLVHPALVVNRFKILSRLKSRSQAIILPPLLIPIANWLVLFPGAAQPSITYAFLGGAKMAAGKQEALSWRIKTPDT